MTEIVKKVAIVVAAKLDASPKVVPDWRNFWKWSSVRWSIAGVFSQIAQSAALAYMIYEFHGAGPVWFQVLVTVFALLCFIASLISRLRKQVLDPSAANDVVDVL